MRKRDDKMKALINKDDVFLNAVILHVHSVLLRETDEKCRENTFNDYSQIIAEILRIEPLEYTKKRAAKFSKTMSAYVKKSQIRMTPYRRLCLELHMETDEERRKELFDRMSKVIANTFQIAPMEYTKERADHFYREMAEHVLHQLPHKE